HQVVTPAICLDLVPHAHPDVGVESVRPGGRPPRIVDLLRPALLEPIRGRARQHDLHSGDRAQSGERARHVVAVPEIGEPQAIELAEALPEGEQVGERLAGMMPRRQAVDHRHARAARQLPYPLIGSGADHDAVEVAGEDPSCVGDRLSAGQLELVGAQDDRRRAQLRHPDLERDTGARRGLLEDQGHRPPHQSVGSLSPLPAALELLGPFQQGQQLIPIDFLAGEEMARWAGGGLRRHEAADTTRVQLTVMTWNLFHGRDWPPEPPLQVRAHKGNFRRGPRLGERYEQANWDLFDRFAGLIRRIDWNVAFFQECPPRWKQRLAEACDAEAHRVLSGRNWLQPLTSLIGSWRPDLLGAWE